MQAVTDHRIHRTLYEIIWCCLVTIFTCTWVAIHPNVPQSSHQENTSGRFGRIRSRVLLTVGVVLVPEHIAYWAIGERLLAGRIVSEYNRICDLEFDDVSGSPPTRRRKWTLTHAFFLLMNGFALYDGKGNQIGPLTPGTLFKILRTKELARKWPPLRVSQEEIEDKSKGDFLTKSIVIVHTTWFAVQCIDRAAVGLPLVQLELITLIFAVTNVVTYIMWWQKPQNINIPIPIVLTDPEVVSHLFLLVASDNAWVMEQRDCEANSAAEPSLVTVVQASYDKARTRLSPRIESFFTALSLPLTFSAEVDPIQTHGQASRGDFIFRFALAILPTALGILHFFAWSTVFPSTTEKYIWFFSSFIYITVPFSGWMPLNFFPELESITRLKTGTRRDLQITAWRVQGAAIRHTLILFPAHFLGRLILFAVAMSCLRSLPETVFRGSQWSRYIPHFQ